MARTPSNGETTRGPWGKGQRSKVSLMHVFRDAFARKDAARSHAGTSEEGTEVSARSKARRIGVGEVQLKAHLHAELAALLNTTRLDAVQSLDDCPHVRGSVVNYGFRDLSTVGLRDLASDAVVRSIRQSLVDYEPRLARDSIRIQTVTPEGDARQFVSFRISADLMGDPVDIPMEFEADVDLGAGKLRLGKLDVRG